MFKTHCLVCYQDFEAATLEQAMVLVTAHEAKKDCECPKYDAKSGRWIKKGETGGA